MSTPQSTADLLEAALASGLVRRITVQAMPPMISAAAIACRPPTASPRSTQAAAIPITGTRREKGATVLASYWRSRKPQTPKPNNVAAKDS